MTAPVVSQNASDLESDYELTLPAANKLHFKGVSKQPGGAKKTYAFDLDLFGDIDTEAELKPQVTGKHLFVTLKKKGASASRPPSPLYELSRVAQS
jgi:hypothetical protein